jgi:hypothetical protein
VTWVGATDADWRVSHERAVDVTDAIMVLATLRGAGQDLRFSFASLGFPNTMRRGQVLAKVGPSFAFVSPPRTTETCSQSSMVDLPLSCLRAVHLLPILQRLV